MRQDSEERHALRQYLLGEIAREDRREQIELRLMTEDEHFEELSACADELIDEYLRGSLNARERERFESHFLSTPERHERLRFARTMRDHLAAMPREAEESERDSTPAARPSRFAWGGLFAPPLLAAVAALLLLAVVLVVWRAASRRSDVDQGLAALREAYRGQRPTEARLSALGYASFVTTRGGGSVTVDQTSHDLAQVYLLKASRGNGGADAAHALGQLYLAEGKTGEAIEKLESALQASPNDARLHSDLGAALIESGKARRADDPGGSGVEFAKSLGHLKRALELDGSLLEALFNRALCYQYLNLPAQAEEDWRHYLERDASSGWAGEARRNLNALAGGRKQSRAPDEPTLLREFLAAYRARDDETAWALVSRNRDLSGSPVENALIDGHLDAVSSGRGDEARESLLALSYAAELEAARADDHFASDVASFYRRITPAAHAPLAEARALLKQGRERLTQAQPEDAAELYARAGKIFRQAGDEAEAVYAGYPLGHCLLLQSKAETALSAFERVQRDGEAARYRWLLAQSLNAAANVQLGLNNYSVALDDSARSLDISERIGDTNGVAKTTLQIAQEYLFLGDYHKSLTMHRRSLELALRYPPEPLQLWRNYFTIAMPLNRLGLNAAAVEFEREALRLAQEQQMPQNICRSYANLGMMYGSLGDYDAATRNVRQAFELAQTLQSESARAENVAYSSLFLGHLYRQAGDPAGAITDYDRAIQLYDGLNSHAFTYAAHKGRLLSCVAAGECPSLDREFETTLSLYEQYHEKIVEESNRDSFFDAEQDVCDAAIGFQYARHGDARAAFDYSEKCRARSLLDIVSAGTPRDDDASRDVRFTSFSQPAGVNKLMKGLPEHVQVLQYAVLEDRVIIWLVSKTDFEHAEQRVTQDELRENVLGYLQSISRPPAGGDDGGETTRRGARLYELLVKPVESRLDPRKQLCIVPDKFLGRLPFAALVAPDGEYLVERYTLIYSPSANVLALSSRGALGKGEAHPERLLSVGNPRFDRAAFPSLPDLPSARGEAEGVAALYPGSRPLLEEQATRSRVEDELGRADVVQLATHFVIDEQSPMRSKLLLAKPTAGVRRSAAESDSAISAYEIYKMKLPARLVVLSACETGAGRYYGGEGTIGAARAFIAAGTPLVVASLWAVDSDATAGLMISFHRNRKPGVATAEALRRAQAKMLGGEDTPYRHPYYWASFIAVGGYAEY